MNTTELPASLSAAIREAGKIEEGHQNAVRLEEQLEDLLDVIPPQSGQEGLYRRLLSELADEYQNLMWSYRKLAGV